MEIQTANINVKWIENIYENVKKVEEFERLAREGCISVLDYVQYPIKNRNSFLCDVQYKNLKLILNELLLVIPDITPVVNDEKIEEFSVKLDKLKKLINNRALFINEHKSNITNTIENAAMTDLFYLALEVVSDLRAELIKLVKHILYIP